MNLQRKEKGFTIIEVVLVLAIAGLIFLMVFLALPALQRNQRDTQRKSDLSRMQTALTSYTSSNRGALPTPNTAASWLTFETTYLTLGGDTFIDPSGGSVSQPAATSVYQLVVTALPATPTFAATQNKIYISIKSVCASGGALTAAGTRSVAFRMVLEGGGIECRNN